MRHARFIGYAALLLASFGCSRSALTIMPQNGGAEAAKPRAAAQDASRPTREPESPPGDGFRFPDDQGGQLLGKLLTPSAKGPGEEDRSRPHQFPRSTAVETPSLPLPHGQPEVARLPLARPKTKPRPGPLPEGPPLSGYHDTPPPPEPQRLPAGERVRLPSEDVDRPVPLPLLGQASPDRAPLDDPTAEASQAAALAAAMPQRTTPAPFLKLTLPDPFENRQVVRLPALPPEVPTPVAAAPRPPKP
jgi:hypothetical protein